MNINKTPYLLLLFFLCQVYTLANVQAQTQRTMNAADIQLALERLNILGSVLYFAAHPDDENTRLISWLANEQKYRTAYLSLTRGDGGQNLIGTEQAEELGLIRTQELLGARRIDGGEQFFSRAVDFGFSKTPEETLRIWDKEEILADAVWTIRRFRPDVIITRFPPDERGGHGHHQASAFLAIEAFHAAADPNRFPEQLKHTTTWQAKRLLWNASVWARSSKPASEQFNINIGDFNPVLGVSYGEIAAESRSVHKSQGFGAPRQRGNQIETFEVLAGDLPVETLMDGVETSWKRINNSENIQKLIEKVQSSFKMTHPEAAIPDLLQLLTALERLAESNWKTQKIKEVKNLILACGGIWFESYAKSPKIAVGENIETTTSFIIRQENVNVEIASLSAQNQKNTIKKPKKLTFNEIHEESVHVPAIQITQPYWLRSGRTLGRFEVTNPLEIGLPENSDAPKVSISLIINGKQIDYERPIVFKHTDPVQGEVYEPVAIVPPITVNLQQKSLVFKGHEPKTIDVVFRNHRATKTQTTVTLSLPKNFLADSQKVSLSFSAKDEEISKQFLIYPGESNNPTDSLRFLLSTANETESAKGFKRIHYTHIPTITWFPEAAAKVYRIETGESAQRIGYLTGAGDLIPEALRAIGLQVDILNEHDIMSSDLSAYDAIVTGIRFYNVNQRAKYIQPILLHYVENGGTLVVQYNVNSGLSVDDLGPYPLSLSRGRVTEEDAAVSILSPNSRVLNYPNKITEKDFEGWIQERGLYFVSTADDRYEMPLSMNDSNEDPLSGSLLVAKHGQGNFVYTSLSFFRQLPAGIPGAYRLFVNLLAKSN